MASNYFTDRVVEYPGRVIMTPVQGEANTYDMSRAEGTVTTEGTPFNAQSFNQIADDIIETADDNIITANELQTIAQALGVTPAKLAGILTAIAGWLTAPPVIAESKTTTYSVNGNATSDAIDILVDNKTGYTCVGCVGVSTGAAGVVLQQMIKYDSSTSARIYLRNTTGTVQTNKTLTMKFLYVKDI